MKPVSVIIPTYNGGLFVRETINSILNQTKPFDEIIVIDDCSSDDSCAQIEDLLAGQSIQKIQFKKNTVNSGPSKIRDLGLSLASNDLVLFMDHDDIAEPNMLEILVGYLAKQDQQNKYVLVHSAYSQIDEYGCFIPGIHRWMQVETEEILGYEFVRNQILSMSGVLLKKEYVIEAGGFDGNLRYSQDWDLWLKMAQFGGFLYVDQPLVRLRRHSGNTSRDINNFLMDEQAVLKKYDLHFIQEAINRRKLPRENNYLDYASILFKLNHLEDARKWIEQAIHLNPRHSSAYFYLGVYFWQQGHLDDADRAFQKVLELRPEDIAAYNNLGCIRILGGDLRMAKEYWQLAVQHSPNYLDALSNLRAIENTTNLCVSDLRFTLRELRPILLTYNPDKTG